jgi:hypothetical protein
MDSNLTGAATPMTDLVPGSTVSTAYGRQSSMAASNLPTTKSDNIKGYIIVPGHITGGGAEGEIRAVEKVAMNIVNKLKAQFPGIPIQLWNIRNYPQTDAGFRKQMSDLKKLEDQGWQVLELHFDAPGGTGRGLIAPYNRSTINPLESELSKLGLYPADWRGLLGPRKGISLFELGNMTDKLREAMDRGDQRAVDYFSRDVISAFQNLTYSGRMPGYAAQRPSQAMPIASRSANLNINYGLPYNSPSQVIIIDRPTVTMVPMGSSGGTQVIPVPTGGGGDSVSVVISNPSNATDLLNKIQEYRLL